MGWWSDYYEDPRSPSEIDRAFKEYEEMPSWEREMREKGYNKGLYPDDDDD